MKQSGVLGGQKAWGCNMGSTLGPRLAHKRNSICQVASTSLDKEGPYVLCMYCSAPGRFELGHVSGPLQANWTE